MNNLCINYAFGTNVYLFANFINKHIFDNSAIIYEQIKNKHVKSKKLIIYNLPVNDIINLAKYNTIIYLFTFENSYSNLKLLIEYIPNLYFVKNEVYECKSEFNISEYITYNSEINSIQNLLMVLNINKNNKHIIYSINSQNTITENINKYLENIDYEFYTELLRLNTNEYVHLHIFDGFAYNTNLLFELIKRFEKIIKNLEIHVYINYNNELFEELDNYLNSREELYYNLNIYNSVCYDRKLKIEESGVCIKK